MAHVLCGSIGKRDRKELAYLMRWTKKQPSDDRQLTVDSSLDAIARRPDARAILERLIPDLLDDPRAQQAMNLSLRHAARFTQGRLNKEMLTQIDQEFRQLDPNAADDEYWTLERLAKLGCSDLIKVFTTLTAPTPDEMNGFFEGRFPIEREEGAQDLFQSYMGGHWIGKTFTVVHDATYDGQGYNSFFDRGHIRQGCRFVWTLKSSDFVEGDALVTEYAAFQSPLGWIDSHDEIRRVRKGLYLGLYDSRVPQPPLTIGMDYQRNRSQPEAFLLLGPVAPWKALTEEVKQRERRLK